MHQNNIQNSINKAGSTTVRAVGFAVIFILVSIFTFIYWKLYDAPDSGVDDANIYFVYAKNLTEGNGFVYNPGSERVEGFTSLLWTLITAAAYAVSSNFEFILLVLNVFITSFTLFLCVDQLYKLTSSRYYFSPAAILFLTFMLLIPGFIEWSVLSLMETGLWSMLLVWLSIQLLEYILSNRIRYGFFNLGIILLLLTRPESLLWAGFFIASLFLIRLWKGHTSLAANKGVLYAIGSYIVTIIALTGFRLAYFGYPLPNTFYAKVSSNMLHNLQAGIRYLLKCCVQTPTLWLLLIAAILSLSMIVYRIGRFRFRQLNRFDLYQALLTGIFLISLLLPVVLGGDHFNFARFYQPFFPIYYLLLFNIPFYRQHLLPGFQPQTTRLSLPAYGLAVLAIPYIYLNSATHLFSFRERSSPLKIEFDIADWGRDNGQKLNILFSRAGRLPSVGVSEAGGFGFTYAGTTIDLLGLNSTRIAHADDKKPKGIKNHSAFSKKAFYELQPDIFFAHSATSFFVADLHDIRDRNLAQSFAARIYDNIFFEAEFGQLYESVIIHDPATELHFLTFCHKDFIRELQLHQYEVIPLEDLQPAKPVVVKY